MNRRELVICLCGGLVVPSLVAAQRPARVYRIGLFMAPWMRDAFAEALQKHGWVQDKNIVFEQSAAGGDPQRANAIAIEWAAKRLDLIVTTGVNLLAVSRATRDIPVVVMTGGYIVEAGFVKSYARPGGNITGLTIYGHGEYIGKCVSLLRELVPSLRELGVLWDYTEPWLSERDVEISIQALRRAARSLNVDARIWTVRTEADSTKALTELARAPVEALFITNGAVHAKPEVSKRIVEFAVARSLPTMSDFAGSFFNAGGLMAYSASVKELAARSAYMTDRILRGAKPAEIPIEIAMRFELIINRKIAKAIGFTIPQSLLLRADRVIE